MRIALSGAHRTGKTTLVADLAERLKRHRVVDEPYLVLEEDGHEFAHPPVEDDYVAQLECSLELLADDAEDILFDRSPLDFVAYLHAIGADADAWTDAIREAMQTLDLIVFVPVETPDRMRLKKSDFHGLRKRVDSRLRIILVDDPLAIGVEVLEVYGSPDERLEQVLRVRPE